MRLIKKFLGLAPDLPAVEAVQFVSTPTETRIPPQIEPVRPPSMAPPPAEPPGRKIILDLETTGVAKDDRIIEVAALELFEDGRIERAFHTLVNPEGKESNRFAQRKHQITPEMLQGQPTFRDIVDALLEFIGDDEIIAHSADFEFRFLRQEFDRLARPPLPKSRFACSLELAREVLPEQASHKLEHLAGYFDLDTTKVQLHRALADCMVLAVVYDGLLKEQDR
nr:3'-5' exonuclease [Ensifer sp. ENS07]